MRSNLRKSNAGWKRYQQRSNHRAFLNRTDAVIHSNLKKEIRPLRGAELMR